jgi:hypothetical protein
VGNIIRVQASPEKIPGKGLGHIRQRDDPCLGAGLKTTPVANILFRPEEIHGASGIGNIFEPFSKRDRGISDQSSGFRAEQNPVLHFHPNRQAAIQAGRLDPDRFPGKKPADRQRFKPSLPEPFLPAVNGDAVLGGKIIKRRKGSDGIGVWKKPSGEHGKREELLNSLSPLFG